MAFAWIVSLYVYFIVLNTVKALGKNSEIIIRDLD